MFWILLTISKMWPFKKRTKEQQSEAVVLERVIDYMKMIIDNITYLKYDSWEKAKFFAIEAKKQLDKAYSQLKIDELNTLSYQVQSLIKLIENNNIDGTVSESRKKKLKINLKGYNQNLLSIHYNKNNYLTI